jgi:hypothetical protein
MANVSAKHLMIDKSNAVMLASVSIAVFLVVFCMFSFKELLVKRSYQARVISEKEKALKQLKDNNKNVSTLVAQYKAFATDSVNIIGGNPGGTGPRDGDNPKLVLDSLPSKYDFPGLVSSIENLLVSGGYSIKGIGGTEDVAQQNATGSDAPVEIALPMTIEGSYDSVQSLFVTLERSIRPIYVDTVSISASGGKIDLSLTTRTFYQPEKLFVVDKKVVQ